MAKDKAFDVIEYLVKNGHTYLGPVHDATAFIKRQCASSQEAAALLHTLYEEGLIDLHPAQLRHALSHGWADYKIMIRARRKAVDEVNKAKDHSQIVLLTRWGIATTIIVAVVAAMLDRCSEPSSRSSPAKAEQVPIEQQSPSIPAPLPSDTLTAK